MIKVKNSLGRLVCKIDAKEKLVEIMHKGNKTIVKFTDTGDFKIINYEKK